MKFFDTPSEMILIIQLNPAGVLMPFLEIPTTGRVKASYFIKKNPVKITKGNYRDVIIPGDMASKPIEELSVLVEEVARLHVRKNINLFKYHSRSRKGTDSYANVLLRLMYRYYQIRRTTRVGRALSAKT